MSTPTTSTAATPNEELAISVARELVAKGFVLEKKHDDIVRKLKSGTATSEDWKLYIEVALEKAEGETLHAHADQ